MIPGKNKTEKIVYFVRHGQSIANVTPVFQSEDSPLSDEGKKQAERIAHRASKINFETLISSPAARTRDTALFISKATGKTIEYSDLFVERKKPSSVSGKSHEDKDACIKFNNWEKTLYKSGVRIEDSENFDDLMVRADNAIKFLTERSERELLVVTHGFFLRTILAKVLLGDSLTPENFENFQWRSSMDNTGISAITYVTTDSGSRWRLWIYNDHAHLAE